MVIFLIWTGWAEILTRGQRQSRCEPRVGVAIETSDISPSLTYLSISCLLKTNIETTIEIIVTDTITIKGANRSLFHPFTTKSL